MGFLSCPLCDKEALTSVQDLQEKVATALSRTLTCPICTSSLPGLYALHHHLSGHMPRIQKAFQHAVNSPESIPSLEKLDISDRKSHPSNLPNTSSTTDNKSVGSVSSCSSAQFNCEFCGLVFATEHFLKLHKDLIHASSNSYDVTCKLCKSRFADMEAYKTHVKDEHSDSRYICDICPKSFKLKGGLLIHNRMIHDHSSPSACRVCNKKFTNKVRKELHERRVHRSLGPPDIKSSDSCSSSVCEARMHLESLRQSTSPPELFAKTLQLDSPQECCDAVSTDVVQPDKQFLAMESGVFDSIRLQQTNGQVTITDADCQSTSVAQNDSNLHVSNNINQLPSSEPDNSSGTPKNFENGFLKSNDTSSTELESRLENLPFNSSSMKPHSPVNAYLKTSAHSSPIAVVQPRLHTVNLNQEVRYDGSSTVSHYNPDQAGSQRRSEKCIQKSSIASVSPALIVSSHEPGPSSSHLPSLLPFISDPHTDVISPSQRIELSLKAKCKDSCVNSSSYTDNFQKAGSQDYTDLRSVSHAGQTTPIFHSLQPDPYQNFTVQIPPNINIGISYLLGNTTFTESSSNVHLSDPDRSPSSKNPTKLSAKQTNISDKGKSHYDASLRSNAEAMRIIAASRTNPSQLKRFTQDCTSRIGDNKQWQCDVCKKCFTTKYFLKKHNRLHTGETPYSCEECGKTFTFQQSYHKHVLYHTDSKPHLCSFCGRAFKEMSTLHNHVRIHTGEKPFACETCGKSFRQRVSYLVHQRIHTGLMPYHCFTCNKSFRYKVSLRSHKCDGKSNGNIAPPTSNPPNSGQPQEAEMLPSHSQEDLVMQTTNTGTAAATQYFGKLAPDSDTNGLPFLETIDFTALENGSFQSFHVPQSDALVQSDYKADMTVTTEPLQQMKQETSVSRDGTSRRSSEAVPNTSRSGSLSYQGMMFANMAPEDADLDNDPLLSLFG